jgi:hypothetical protein
MNKRIYYNFIGLTFLAILLIGGLYWNAERPYNIKNGFNRKLSQIIKQSLAFRLPTDLVGLALTGNRTCYFYGAEPQKIYRMDLQTLKLDTLDIPLHSMGKDGGQFNLQANAGQLYIRYPNKKQIFSYIPVSKSVVSNALISLPYQLLFIDRDKLIMISSDSNSRPTLLKQSIIGTKSLAELRPWPKEKNGIIPVDGALNYDPVTKLLVYHYYRKNGFITLDTNLNKVNRGRTVDTVMKGNVKIKAINGSFTLAAPPKTVNGRACAANGKLYINGRLKADNEATTEYRNHTVIDVYDLVKGIYLYSFYVPVFNEQKTNTFGVSGDKLICLYGDYVVVYKIKAVA